ncbi:2-C-methyl-D-erythritol 4-phosphate cytidylyltransferase [Sharpea porci]|uniref:2-C-methyl-D-erythritol 4-phosphate cytidylyltransferase n=1 Tax=Sharpea porci TaxID=2652286 RepID=UPI002A915791|nr:2-C-methyl-D-erythritol 4-phosphate cytidylyltransferase [Sharpea porci]MDY5279879.1 2-C-methyl-D-erythritol 4-phosphate cytidylyltransferase [Sharpea porci]
MNYSAIILCAGAGKRTHLSYNKMFYVIDGQTVYEKTMHVFLNDPRCQQIIVVTKKEEQEDFQKLITDSRIVYVEGGAERQDSVFNGLKAVNQDYVMIHDGARCFIKPDLLDRLYASLEEHDATLAMVPSIDTVKRVRDGKVVETLKRSELYNAQTPQAFKTSLITKAYHYVNEHHLAVTDDASCVEAMNEDVYVVMGDYDNKKITTPQDL